MQEKQTKIINLFGGPGSGKSTGAAYIFAKLKLAGVDAEYVSEFAKDKVWENNKEVFKCQMYVSGKQMFKITRCYGKVDIIITDSPFVLGAIYSPEKVKLVDALIEEFDQYKWVNHNFFIKRIKKYNHNGRHQTEEEANEIDYKLRDFLENKVHNHYIEVDGNVDGYDKIVEYVLNLIN
ncbi:MAG: DNA recombination/repair protein RecA [Candidatus Muirbacterium halophilum]|nr:DNA recombination/repair protein RecA [Candidatus Muirbacterium halophilum]